MTALASPISRKRPWLKKTIVRSIVLIGVTAAGAKMALAVRDAKNAARKSVII